ncbi:hypothetical protein PRIPAC_80660 [Pristionchus pacificus]|uniref:Uncharacterized protein n=1 Tax=Pristionchus pacificus TaxID=54126 RepID=A0A2A6CPZ2_PRIPA|nr:hypothetical protein PRIPAC_80660 [Pristionchus pacificus]|eukprot:PDM80274.1 hypothetical protein PRIPAC_32853 [Pristionchus pacificus]
MTEGEYHSSRINPQRLIQLTIIVMIAFAVFFTCLFALHRIKVKEDEKRKRNDSVKYGESPENNNITSISI